MADQPLFDLSTLITRPVFALDGVKYELFAADELSVLASHRFGVWGREIERLAKSDDPDDGERLEELIDLAAAAAIVDMPADVYAKLTGAHKQTVVDVFTALLLQRALGVAGAMATAIGDERIGEKLFPGFSASSAATRNGGWLKRLLRWCGLI